MLGTVSHQCLRLLKKNFSNFLRKIFFFPRMVDKDKRHNPYRNIVKVSTEITGFLFIFRSISMKKHLSLQRKKPYVYLMSSFIFVFFLINEVPNVREISYLTSITVIRTKCVFFICLQTRKSSKFPSRLSP